MEPTEILVKVKLSPKVIEGLPEGKIYHCIYSSGEETMLGSSYLKHHNKEHIPHIYLPLTVTTEMVEKEAERYVTVVGIKNPIFSKIDFKAGINWLLSLNKE